MPRHRYQTYVFDTTPDLAPAFDPKRRNVLGQNYKEAPPCAWMDGHALREKHTLEDFVRDLRDHGHTYTGEDIADKAEKIMEELRFG